ncbi:MAG: O-acetyl-ADP-ribose deacetylase [Thermodesulfobacteria bacterium]|nr:O-acetyl-ADP-ribose deacetylase [Thermodesulfobacteriota bacterium]
MQVKVGDCILEIVKGDITEQDTEAIVNAANEALIPGGGVDGAIHRKGGPEILEELRSKYKGCPTGNAVITGGGKLKAKFVIHAVGPVYKGGNRGEAELLKKTYESALKLALEHGISSISFPAISTGAYRFPLEEAAKIAISTVIEFIKKHNSPKLVRFVLWTDDAYQTFSQVTKEISPNLS